MRKMMAYGYNEGASLNILKSGLKGYYNMLKEEVEGEQPLNRPTNMGQDGRDRRRLTGWSRDGVRCLPQGQESKN